MSRAITTHWAMVGSLLLPALSFAAPVIDSQPQHQVAMSGGKGVFTLEASGSTPLRYQWFRENFSLPLQTNSTLGFTNVTLDHMANYSCQVTDGTNTVTSDSGFLLVNKLPVSEVVGYANVLARPGFSLLTQVLIDAHQNVGYTLSSVPHGCTIYKLNGNGFAANNYLHGWSDPEMNLLPGEGWFFHNPTSSNLNLTFVGTVLTGSMTNYLPLGNSLASSIVPQGGGISSVLKLNPSVGTKLYRHSANGFSAFEQTSDGWWPAEPEIQVGEAFWIKPASIEAWYRFFDPTQLKKSANFHFVAAGPASSKSFRMIHNPAFSETPEVNFFTYRLDSTKGRAYDIDGTTPLGSNFVGQLYRADQDGNSFCPIGRPVEFSSGSAAGYIRGATVKVFGATSGTNITLQLRVWEKALGDSFEIALSYGSKVGLSGLFNCVAKAPTMADEPQEPPQNANNFPSFCVTPALEAKVIRAKILGSQIRVYFENAKGKRYRLESRLDLGNTSWEAVPGVENYIGTGCTAEVVQPATNPRSFYRVKALP